MHSHDQFLDDISAMDRLIDQSLELHSAPQVARSILNLTRNLDYEVKDVVGCLERDPALAAKVLRMLNSSRFGLRHPVTNLRQAVTLLGQRSLRMVAMTFSLIDGLTQGPASAIYQEYWKRALTMATIAGRLAKQDPKTSHHDAYTAGLLADLGVLVIAQHSGNKYQKIWERYHHGMELVEAEREEFGFGHPALGARLLQRWDFPNGLVDAALSHHDAAYHDDEMRDCMLETAVHAGNLFANVLWTRKSPSLTPLRQLLEHEFSIDLDQFIGLAKACKDDISLDVQIFDITLQGEIDCEALRAEATERLDSDASAATFEDVVDHESGSHETRLTESLPADHEQTSLDEDVTELRSTGELHLGHAEVLIYRELDALRQGIPAELVQISALQSSFNLEQPLIPHERIRIQVRNENQRFLDVILAIVQTNRLRGDGRFEVKLEHCFPMRTVELSALRRAGVFDGPLLEKIWY